MKNLFYRLDLNHIWGAMRKRLCKKTRIKENSPHRTGRKGGHPGLPRRH